MAKSEKISGAYYCAIKCKHNGAFITGCDFNFYPPRVIFADQYHTTPLLFPLYHNEDYWNMEFARRKLSKRYYEVVTVKVVEVNAEK